jgi:hypothetical protein
VRRADNLVQLHIAVAKRTPIAAHLSQAETQKFALTGQDET